MDTKQIILKKQSGDIRLVAEIIGVSYDNADRILRRPNAKLHQKAVAALTKIIEDRERSVEEAKELVKEQ